MKCPKCGKDELQNMYARQELKSDKGARKRTFKALGYVCLNPDCDFCVKSKPEKMSE
jgi:hypothetical protein